jgi:hypothetical protein
MLAEATTTQPWRKYSAMIHGQFVLKWSQMSAGRTKSLLQSVTGRVTGDVGNTLHRTPPAFGRLPRHYSALPVAACAFAGSQIRSRVIAPDKRRSAAAYQECRSEQHRSVPKHGCPVTRTIHLPAAHVATAHPRPFQLTIRQSIPTNFLQNNRRTHQTPTPIAEATLHRPRLP